MNLPAEMKRKLAEEGADFEELFGSTYQQIERLGFKFHAQDSPNVIAEHPKNGVNCIALWVRGRTGARRIEGEIRVDGLPVDMLSTGMRDSVILRKYDRYKAPIWVLQLIETEADCGQFCELAKRILSRTPNWGK